MPKNGLSMRFYNGANEGIRTPDLLITKVDGKCGVMQVLCG